MPNCLWSREAVWDVESIGALPGAEMNGRERQTIQGVQGGVVQFGTMGTWRGPDRSPMWVACRPGRDLSVVRCCDPETCYLCRTLRSHGQAYNRVKSL